MAKAARATVAGPSIIDLMRDDRFLASSFRPAESWERWMVALAAAFGLPPPKCKGIDPVAFYREHTGRSKWPLGIVSTFLALIVGRRGGKSRISAVIAVYLAFFRNYAAYLSPGEVGVVMVLAADRRQARVAFRYIRAMLMGNPLFADLVTGETAESITLKNIYGNPICVEVHTASFRSTRGYTVVAAICDEIAFWNTDGANPDEEIINAIEGATATIPTAMLVLISSPHARAGVLWEAHKGHFGDHGDPATFVWQAATRDMNPSVRQSFIDKRYARDPAKARAEYGAEFRTDVERFVPTEVVSACTVEGRIANPPAAGVTYRGFVDPSGGSSDAMTLAIGHRDDKGTIIHDAHIAVKAPFKPTAAVREMKPLLDLYRVRRVSGDRYGGEWPRETFQNEGIEYELHGRPKSELYVDMLPRLTSRGLELLDLPYLATELTSLERRKSPSGREIVDHPRGGHDDNANAVAGLVDLLAKGPELSAVWGSGRAISRR